MNEQVPKYAVVVAQALKRVDALPTNESIRHARTEGRVISNGAREGVPGNIELMYQLDIGQRTSSESDKT